MDQGFIPALLAWLPHFPYCQPMPWSPLPTFCCSSCPSLCPPCSGTTSNTNPPGRPCGQEGSNIFSFLFHYHPKAFLLLSVPSTRALSHPHPSSRAFASFMPSAQGISSLFTHSLLSWLIWALKALQSLIVLYGTRGWHPGRMVAWETRGGGMMRGFPAMGFSKEGLSPSPGKACPCSWGRESCT